MFLNLIFKCGDLLEDKDLNKKFFNVKEIAEMLDVSEETIRRWIREGKIRAVSASRKQGNKIAKEDLEDFLRKNKDSGKIGKAAMLGLSAMSFGIPILGASVVGAAGLGLLKCLLKDKGELGEVVLKKIFEPENLDDPVENEKAAKNLDLLEEQLVFIEKQIDELNSKILSKKSEILKLNEEVDNFEKEKEKKEEKLKELSMYEEILKMRKEE